MWKVQGYESNLLGSDIINASFIQDRQADQGQFSELMDYPPPISQIPTPTENSAKNIQFLRNLYQTPPQNQCLSHGHKLQFVCCTCRQLKCRQCLSTPCDTHYAWNDHDIVSIKTYWARIKNQSKKMDLRNQENCLNFYKEKSQDEMNTMAKKVTQIKIATTKCITQLHENYKKFETLIKSAIETQQLACDREIQLKSRKIQQERIITEIANCEEETWALEVIINNWKNIRDFGKKQKLERKESGVDNTLLQNCERIYDSLRTIMANIQKQILKATQIVNTTQNSTSRSKKNSNLALTPEKKLIKSPSALSSISPSASTTLHRSFLGSITKILNDQMKKKPSKPIKNQIPSISMYGGNAKNSLISTYKPHKNIKTSPLSSQFNIRQTLSHTDFGHFQPKKKGNTFIVVLGGYIDDEITDCVFRVDYGKNKKELAGRLEEPLAQFGFQTEQKMNQNGKIGIFGYICGGINQKNCPQSNFFSLEFSQQGGIISKTQLTKMEQPRCSLTLTMHKSILFAIGGRDSQNRGLKTVSQYCQRQKNWTRVGDLCYQRWGHRTISLKSGLYVIGGYNGQNYLQSVEHYHEAKRKFEICMDMGQARSNYGVMSSHDPNSIIILGGMNYQPLTSCQLLNVKLKKSRSLTPLDHPNYGFTCF